MKSVASELTALVDSTAARLHKIDDDAAQERPAPEKWSIQEIVGHLLDSAVNNHHRFVRAQHNENFTFPDYQQDAWSAVQQYNEAEWADLVELWRLYNRHLAHVIAHLPEENRAIRCTITPHEPVKLGFLIEDYVEHIKHHVLRIEEICDEE